MNLKETILNLCLLKQEGGYWDFKKQWYDKDHKQDMLHDIICMANNIENRDAYIIIGIDEENDLSITGVEEDNNRRNTQNLVDFLKDKKFAGDMRPTVCVETIEIDDKLVDVIKVCNSLNTPFYLKERFLQLNPNNIYARIQDTNTPVNRSAGINIVELLWKKRFGLLLTPIEHFNYLLLDKSHWKVSPVQSKVVYYHELEPQYVIEYELTDPQFRTGYEYFFLNQCDNKPIWTVVRLIYFNTCLMELSGNDLDGGRHFTNTPLLDGISIKQSIKWDVSYRYWITNTLEYNVHLFFLEENNSVAMSSERSLMENVLVFEDENEHQLFNYYVETHWCNKDEYIDRDYRVYIPEVIGYDLNIFAEQLSNIQILQNMLIEFRKENEFKTTNIQL